MSEGFRQSRCRSCGGTIVWAKASKSGKWLPFNAEADARGTFVLMVDLGATEPTAINYREFKSTPLAPLYRERWTPHWATCPNAATHRRAQ